MIVFISGSAKLKKLTNEMTACLDEYMSKHASFIVGDCYGADELAQKYLKSKNYEDVTVYCSQEKPAKRCHYTNFVSLYEQSKDKTGNEFFEVKDKAMCEKCDEAVMFWNGSSYGVKRNIMQCIDLDKACQIFVDCKPNDDQLALQEVIQHAAAKEDIKRMPYFTFNQFMNSMLGLPHSSVHV